MRESVLPFVKGLCDLYQWEYHYRTFDSDNDLGLWIEKFSKLRRKGQEKIIYIATHGTTKGLLWTLEQKIPLDILIDAIRPTSSITGLHLGACHLGQSPETLALLEETSLRWVASYAQEVPWLESTVLDLLFWTWMYVGAPRKIRVRRLSAEQSAHELYERFQFSRDMGFNVLSRLPKRGGISFSWEAWDLKKKS